MGFSDSPCKGNNAPKNAISRYLEFLPSSIPTEKVLKVIELKVKESCTNLAGSNLLDHVIFPVVPNPPVDTFNEWSVNVSLFVYFLFILILTSYIIYSINILTSICFQPIVVRILNPNANTFVSNKIPCGPKFDLNPSASTFYPARSADISININDDEIIPLGQSNNSIENCVENEKTPNAILHDLRVKNWKRVGALNINSLHNKIHMLADLVVGKIDILLISETKLDDSFPTSQFYIPGFGSPFRLDRSMHGEAFYFM